VGPQAVAATTVIGLERTRFIMLAQHTPKQNHLLTALPAAEYERLLPDLELVPLELGGALYESGSQQEYVYFPTASIVSLLYDMVDGSSAEIAVVGNEGAVGIALFMGGETTPSRAVVQSAGHGYRLKASLLKREFERGGPLQYLLLRYTQTLITQMAQTAVCNRHHSVEQQLCRWLLLSLDRLPSNELAMTQELIASLLGVRREGVAEAAGKLQAAGLIQYGRGKVAVLDRQELEARCCECYAVVKRESDRLSSRKTANVEVLL
jgi:CRP-like cAMP-binding protein